MANNGNIKPNNSKGWHSNEMYHEEFPKMLCHVWKTSMLSLSFVMSIYTIIKSMRTFWLVNQLWFIVPVNPWKFLVSSELLYKSKRPQVFMVYRLINHLWCWKNTRRIRKSLACGSWFTNSSRVLPTSRVVYQAINHRNLWSIA